MSIKAGTYLRVETKPSPGQKSDTTPFGTCVWQVQELELECPEPWRKKDASGKELPKDKIPNDGVKCVMIGGSGPSARAGYAVIDSMLSINRDIAEGRTTIIPKEDVVRIEQALKKVATNMASGNTATGCLEID